MDFFERQRQAKKKTGRLVFLFFIAVLFIGMLNFFLIGIALSLISAYEGEGNYTKFQDPVFGLVVVLVTLGIILLAGLYRHFQLREGGSSIAAMMNGRLVNMGTVEPDERKLMNVVEEMAIASSVPMPQVYVLDGEQGINAFAAGFAMDDAVVGVTEGCMRKLSREELQGVIAHEFSHILNNDMRLNLRLVAVIFGLVALAELGRLFLDVGASSSRSRRSSRDGDGGGGIALIGIILMATSGLGILMGKVIKSAVSRQREYLADSSAVQFTRNPEGLAGALKKIGAGGSRLNASKASEASHMFFGNALKKSWFSFTSTHPPLIERIQLLEPSFDGDFSEVKFEERPQPTPVVEQSQQAATGQAGLPISGIDQALGQALPPAIAGISAAALVDSVGTLKQEQIDFAAALLASLPPAIREAAHEPHDACALIFALLLDRRDEVIRKKQLGQVEDMFGGEMSAVTLRLSDLMAELDPRAKLPLADLAVGSLRRIAREQFDSFIRLLESLAAADEHIDLFEYSLSKLVIRHLESHFTKQRAKTAQVYSLKRLGHECGLLISSLAYAAGSDEDSVRAAYQAGADQLSVETQIGQLPTSECGLEELDQALASLAGVSPKFKRQLVQSAAATVSADGYLQIQEAELLRAISDSLGCPMPPLAVSLEEAA